MGINASYTSHYKQSLYLDSADNTPFLNTPNTGGRLRLAV